MTMDDMRTIPYSGFIKKKPDSWEKSGLSKSLVSYLDHNSRFRPHLFFIKACQF